MKSRPTETPQVVVRTGYDLRWRDADKFMDASEHFKWTVFVNRAGTRAHFVAPDVPLVLKGIKMPKVAGWSKQAIAEYVHRVYGKYINF